MSTILGGHSHLCSSSAKPNRLDYIASNAAAVARLLFKHPPKACDGAEIAASSPNSRTADNNQLGELVGRIIHVISRQSSRRSRKARCKICIINSRDNYRRASQVVTVPYSTTTLLLLLLFTTSCWLAIMARQKSSKEKLLNAHYKFWDSWREDKE